MPKNNFRAKDIITVCPSSGRFWLINHFKSLTFYGDNVLLFIRLRGIIYYIFVLYGILYTGRPFNVHVFKENIP